MTTSMEGRLALVTGASRGIGAVVARGLATRGATVLCLARDGEPLEAAVAGLVDDGLDAVALPCDLADDDALDALAGRVERVGEVDVLVHCAAVMSDKGAKTLRTTPQEWRRVMAVDLDAAFRLTTTVGPGMAARRRGRIVHYSACLGRMSGPGNAGGLAPYRIAKAGVNAMVRNLSHELGHGRRGVLVDAVCPGHCRTDMGGPEAPRSPEEGADTGLWLVERDALDPDGAPVVTGRLWEDRAVVPW
ncbi:SDR family NAD(P)-dependent oxidoreductase [Rhodococcus antarcticus]|uniref:SDR family NAD(P)-dependent oxidoreductase n=1 Tax=Rhodococcus antarcticus TaxID=2987751 RepID=A0ABY6P0M8_9NOCA|nr:SDR family NAD(P)-dependent oxidoreductase [Rhodococcus antarcticus]UZJ24821.1 SDR family NAD(P)-dependent oxidoreductase [Rhodococcus antarcticus]